MKHEFSLDEPDVLRRSPFIQNGMDLQELEANVFAASFLMPRWLVIRTSQARGWGTSDFSDAKTVYQLALRLGTSYSSTVYTLQRYSMVTPSTAKELLSVKPRDLKVGLLSEFKPENYYGDVWELTAQDEGTVIAGSKNDHFVLRLKEHSTSGYLWNIEELAASGFAVVQDQYSGDTGDRVGGISERKITAHLNAPGRGNFKLFEARPWSMADELGAVSISYDLTGPEVSGLSRAERRRRLQAA